MANYCPNCGNNVDSNASFCSNCGTALNGGANTNGNTTTANDSSSTANKVLGTLVTVTLLGGLTRQLYYHNGRYFMDPYCRNPFMGPRIIGHHRHMGMHHGHIGPRGGFHGGGPRGGHR